MTNNPAYHTGEYRSPVFPYPGLDGPGRPGYNDHISVMAGDGSAVAWEIIFYKTFYGKRPVADFLRSLKPAERAKIGETFDLVQKFGPHVGMPFVRHLNNDIWEMRTPFAGQAFRVFFFIDSNKLMAVHGIVKKTMKTPANDIHIAIDRMKDHIQRKDDKE